jgi:hypothetical protein
LAFLAIVVFAIGVGINELHGPNPAGIPLWYVALVSSAMSGFFLGAAVPFGWFFLVLRESPSSTDSADAAIVS